MYPENSGTLRASDLLPKKTKHSTNSQGMEATQDPTRESSDQSQVQSVFKQHHDEIRRRSNLSASAELNTATFERVKDDSSDDPFRHADQIYVLFSLSQEDFGPKPEQVSNPAICIYGLFETRSEAEQHASLIQMEHPQFSLLIDVSHRWILAPRSVCNLTNSEYVSAKTESMLSMYETEREVNCKEFEENVSLKRMGKVRTEEESVDRSVEEVQGHSSSHKVRGACRVDEQNVAVVSFIPGEEEEYPEFLFRVYAAYADETSANRYVRNTCGDHVRDYDIDVVKLCCWVYPQRMLGKNAKKEVYRAAELNSVMQAHKRNPQDVERFYRDHESWEVVDKREAPHIVDSSTLD